MNESNEPCDHNALTFIAKTWSIKCYKCGKAWSIAEIKEALALLESEPRLSSVSNDIMTIMGMVEHISESLHSLDKRIHRYVT